MKWGCPLPKQIVVVGPPGTGKCVDPETLVLTDHGIKPIGELCSSWPEPGQTADLRVAVIGLFGRQESSHFYNGGIQPRRRLRTRRGFELLGTFEHPVWAMREGVSQWVKLGDLKHTDRVAIQREVLAFPKIEPGLPDLNQVAPIGYKKPKDVKVPSLMSPELAEWLGWFVSEGCNQIGSRVSLSFCNYSPWVIERMEALNGELFGLSFGWRKSSTDFSLISVRVKKWLKAIGVDGLSADKQVPGPVLCATRQSQVAYLKAAFEADGWVTAGGKEVGFASASRKMVSQVQIMLLNFGIIACHGLKKAKTKRWGERTYHSLTITGREVEVFASRIGFCGGVKNSFVQEPKIKSNAWDLQGLPADFVGAQYRSIRSMMKERGITKTKAFWHQEKSLIRSLSGKRSDTTQQLVCRPMIRHGLVAFSDVHESEGYKNLLSEYRSKRVWEEITVLEDAGEGQVVDLTVPEGHSFQSNGMISHNTSTMTAFTEDWFKHGVDSREIAYLAFTKAAANEAAGRIIGEEEQGYDEDVAKRFPYFRTIHSLAYQGLRREFPDTRLMTTADMKRFGEWSSMDGTFLCDKWEDLASVYQKLQGGGKSEWDDCIRAYTISRMSCRTLDQVERSKVEMSRKAAKSIGQVDASAYQAFVKKYETYKNDNGLIDFTDMLVHALTKMKPIEGVRHVVIDEAQDLSPICVALCDRLFESAETCFWAGDEDQAIYLFSGADAKLFIDRYWKADSKILLRQTHRFGQEIWDLADRVIRKVSERIPKTVFGREGMKHHLSVSGQFEPFVGEALILHRHVAGCQELSSAYRNKGMPFRNERGDDPLGYGKRVENFRTLNDLADGKQVPGLSATEFITEFVPSTMTDPGGKTTRLVTRGSMKKLNAEPIPGQVNLYDLQNAKVLTAEGVDAIKMRYYNVFEHSEDFQFYHQVLDNGYKLTGPNIPVITTLHGSKGRQAKKVVVFSEMSKKCWEDEDSEHRLAFVAMTRTEGDLQICAQQTVDWARETYDYPIKKESHG